MRTAALAVVFLTATFSIILLPRFTPTSMRPTAILLVLLTAAASASLLLPRLVQPEKPPPVVVHSNGPTTEKLERLSQLVAMRIQVADILVAEGQGCRGSWLLKGDACVSIDMSRAQIINKQEETKQATIVLPEPQVLQERVDHSRTRTWSVERVAWLPWSADQDALRDSVYAEGQKLVAHTAASAENLQAARATAEVVIKALYAEVGWNVAVKWDSETSGK